MGRLAARFGLSRSTLLYYDRLGLLSPSRSGSGYRRYAAADVDRLAAICRLRRAGLPLETIGRLLDSPVPELVETLAVRLGEIDEQVAALRAQQRLILAALAGVGEGGDEVSGASGARETGARGGAVGTVGTGWVPDRAALVALLEHAGLSAAGRLAWHAAAERADGPLHQALLEALGLAEDEIAALRRWRGDEPGATVGR